MPQYLKALIAARDCCPDRDTSLLLTGLIKYAWCTHTDADEMEALADRIEADASLLADELRTGVKNLRDRRAQDEFWHAA